MLWEGATGKEHFFLTSPYFFHKIAEWASSKGNSFLFSPKFSHQTSISLNLSIFVLWSVIDHYQYLKEHETELPVTDIVLFSSPKFSHNCSSPKYCLKFNLSIFVFSFLEGIDHFFIGHFLYDLLNITTKLKPHYRSKL